MPPFVNRTNELDRLTKLYTSNSPNLSVIYGRRRMGKTALVVKSIENREDAVYHQAAHGTPEQQLDSFIADATTAFPGINRIRKDWENVLTYLAEQDAIVILDEFPYLVDENEALPSIIQRLWDHEVEETAATFVLTGSAIGMIHNIALDGSSPLYGRISKRPNGKLNIGPLPFGAAMTFFPDYDPAEQVVAYGVFGGTPDYLRAVDDSQSLKENITETLLLRDGGLHEEPENVLYRELDEVDRYFAVLKAMAEGNRQRNEIVQAASINANSAGYYLSRLRELQIIEQEYPVTVDPSRSRNSRYRILDQLFAFWFRFVHGRSSRYEVFGPDAYDELVEPYLSDFVSGTFEQLCQRAILFEYGDEYTFTEEPDTWWDTNGREIDIVAPTNSDTLVVGEVKFTQQRLGYDVFAQLRQEAPHIDWVPNGGEEPDYEYALFSRSGFASSLEETRDERDDLRLYTVGDVVETITE
ncbi:ATP-binding protein [Haladaptatus sp. CMAA 1911]|uniref:ATP-binding protein n=1 Tax=unclassified Haladaptatus TaxID=2622732 RepID=UPI0037544511